MPRPHLTPESPVILPAAPRISGLRSRLPLEGAVLLGVEDSRFAAEALRLLCQRSGCRLRRAETLQAARAHLRAYRPDAVIVDLGLPDGSGLTLIRDLACSGPGAPPILATSGDPDLGQIALDAGAQAFLAKPLDSLASFQRRVAALLPDRPAPAEAASDQPLAPDPLALRDDLLHAAELTAWLAAEARPDPEVTGYLAAFVAGLARISHDPPLDSAARATLHSPAALEPLASLLQDRIRSSSTL